MKKVTKSFVAILALVAMLTQNAFGVYAQATAPEPIQVENEYVSENAEPTVEVTTEEASANTQESNEGDMAEPVADTSSEPVDATLDVENLPPTDDVNYDDQIMLIDDTAEVPEEGTDVVVEEPVTEEVIEEEIPEQLDIYDNQISGSGLNELEIFINTEQLVTGDSFRILFSGPDSAQYDTRLNDYLDTTSHGLYRFLDLNNEGFNIRATSDDNVKFEFTSDNGIPVIKAISDDADANRTFEITSVSDRDGKPVVALTGEGYSNVLVKLDTKKVAAKAEFSVYVDTTADATINGQNAKSIDCTKETSEIELSNLDKKQFTVYVLGKEGFDITSDASVNSVENGEATIYVCGDELRTKKEYTYSDDEVEVKATLQYADAVPDDAQFRVTKIDSQSMLEAFKKAINDSTDGEVARDDNFLLYDVAFIVQKTDEEGNLIDGEEEFEPEAGSVSIDIKFKKSQLTDEVGATDDDSVTVYHLPLKDNVKENIDTTMDATNVKASDIIVEEVEAEVSVQENGTDEVVMSLDSLSPIGLTINGVSYNPGTLNTYDKILGSAKNYGIVASDMTLGGHMETNFAVTNLHGGADIQGPKNESAGGYTYIGSYDGSGVKITPDYTTQTMAIVTTIDALKNFGFNMTGLPQTYDGQWRSLPEDTKYLKFPNNVDVDYTSKSYSDIKAMVDGILSEVNAKSTSMFNETTATDFTAIKGNSKNVDSEGKVTIDIAASNSEAGTYYINFDEGEFNDTKLKIKIKSGQNVVLNIPDKKVRLGGYDLYIDDKQVAYDVNEGADGICQLICYNCPNAESAETISLITAPAATFILPNAEKFEVGNVAAGWLVTKKITRIGSEWHCVYKDLPNPRPNPTSLKLKVKKTVRNLRDVNALEPFQFELYKTASDYYSYEANKIDTVTVTKDSYIRTDGNYVGNATFKDIQIGEDEYNESNHELYYVIKEVMTEEQKKTWSSFDGIWAHVKVTIDKREYTSENGQQVTDYYVKDVVYSHDISENRTLENTKTVDGTDYVIPFTNTKHSTIDQLELDVTKRFTDSTTDLDWPVNDAKFTFKIEALTQNNCGKVNIVNEPAPLPEKTEITVSKDNRVAHFDKIQFSHVVTEDKHIKYTRTQEWYDTQGKSWGYSGPIDNATVYPRCYMYMISEVIPASATETKVIDGVTYKHDPLTGISYSTKNQYVKVWVNSCVGKGGSPKWIEISVNGSDSLEYCGGSIDNIEFVNKYTEPKGALKVTKEVITNKGNSYATNDTFYFKVMKDNTQVGTLHEIKKDQTVTVDNLPLGTYSIVETDADGGEVVGYYASIDQKTVEVKANQTEATVPIVKITNTVEVLPATVTIGGRKTVNAGYKISDKEFEFVLNASPANAPMPAESSYGSKTVTNNGQEFTFGEISYSESDVRNEPYVYTITETYTDGNESKGFLQNNQTYQVEVAVTLSGNQVVATPTRKKLVGNSYVGMNINEDIVFNNTFVATKPLDFKATKILHGRDMSANEFTFCLTAKNDNAKGKMPAGAVNNVVTKTAPAAKDGVATTVNFGGVSFDLNDIGKTFKYEVTEQQKSGEGLICDANVYTVEVTPVLSASNTLELQVDKTEYYKTGATDYIEVPFNNYYDAKGSKQFIVKKTFGAGVPDTTVFHFSLYAKGSATPIETVDITGNGMAYGTASFKIIEYKKADAGKTYNYIVKEIQPVASQGHPVTTKIINGKTYNVQDGIIYDPSEQEFSVTLTDDGKGNIVPTVKKGTAVVADDAPVAEFKNDYGTEPTNIVLDGKKTLNKPILAGQYKVSIEKAADSPDDTPMPTDAEGTKVTEVEIGPGTSEGIFSFPAITYEKTGTYSYKVTETVTDVAGVTYDKSYYIAEVTVRDNGRGALVASKAIQKYVLNSDNEYVASGSKTADTQMIFNNTYDAKNSTTFTGTKSVEGGIRTAQSGQFKFGIYEKDNNEYVALNKDRKSYETTNNGNVVTFPSIEYKLSDLKGESSKTFTYYLHEIEPTDNDKLKGYTYDPNYYEVTVTVSDNGDGTLDIQKSDSATATEFKNKYEAEGTTTIQATKSLIGGDTNATYNFNVKMTPLTTGDTNTADIQTINVKGGGSATVSFKELKYTKLGTYQYLVEEVTEGEGIYEDVIYDTNKYTVEVTVTDSVENGKLNVTKKVVGHENMSTIPFENRIPVESGATFSAKKTMTGRALKAGEFKFNIKEVGGSYEKKNVSNTLGGAVDLGSVTYKKSDAGQHVYEIWEDLNGAEAENDYTVNHVTYDPTHWFAVVDVAVAADGTKMVVKGPVYHRGSASGEVVQSGAAFSNSYNASQSVQFTGKKSLYTSENKTNSSKIDLGNRKFAFQLKDANGDIIKQGAEKADYVTNDSEGNFSFDEITYTQADLTDDCKITVGGKDKYFKYYTISELDNNVPGCSIDTREYTVVVTLEIASNGDIEKHIYSYEPDAEKSGLTELKDKVVAFLNKGDGTNIEFKNVYTATGELDLSVTKVFEGRNWNGATFKFDLRNSTTVTDKISAWFSKFINVAPADTVTVSESEPTKSFEKITYDVEQLGGAASKTFTYYINEDIPGDADKLKGVTYDDNVYEVIVAVTDVASGKLSVSAQINKIDKDGKSTKIEDVISKEIVDEEANTSVMVCEPSVMQFTNTYRPKDITAVIEGKKVLTGREITEDDVFEFTISGSPLVTADGSVFATTVQAGKDGNFAFGEMKFVPEDLEDAVVAADGTKSKVFEYTISEVKGEAPGITYDENSYVVTVTVTDDGTGELSAVVGYPEGGLQFTNDFENAGKIKYAVKKTVEGTSAADKEFTFYLKSKTATDPNRVNGAELLDTIKVKAGETIEFKELEYSLQDTLERGTGNPKKLVYEYEITEDQTEIPGYTMSKQVYEGTVTVIAHEENGELEVIKTLKQTVAKDGSAEEVLKGATDPALFVNTYNASGFTSVPFTKVLEGRNILKDEFTFYLKNEAGDILETRSSVEAVLEADKKAKNSFTFGGDTADSKLKYTTTDLLSGNTYADNTILYYTVEEDTEGAVLDEKTGKLTKGAITYDQGITVVAVFIDNPGTGNLTVKRVFGRFETSREDAISQMKALVASKMEGKKSFAEKIANIESASGFAKTVTITNGYDANGEWDPSGLKKLTGRALKDNEFTFSLTEYELGKDIKDSNIVKKDGVKNQAIGHNGGKNSEQIIFSPDDLKFLKYSLADLGKHRYIIKEEIPDAAKEIKNDSGVVTGYELEGVTYDINQFEYIVEVKDNGDGTLAVDYAAESPCKKPQTGDVYFTFNNHYNANAYIDLVGTKILEGRDLDDIFGFKIKDITSGSKTYGNEVPASNDKETGIITFSHDEVPFLNYAVNETSTADLGYHYYEIVETSKSANGITCDETVYTVTVNVTDDGKGNMSAMVVDVKYAAEGGASKNYAFSNAEGSVNHFAFTNTYCAKADVEIKGVKHLYDAEGNELNSAAQLAGKYTFSIYEYDNAARTGKSKLVAGPVGCDGDGKYTLSLVGAEGKGYFTQEDLKNGSSYLDSKTFYYQIVENKPAEGTWDGDTFTSNGITYDNTVYNMNVTVKPALDKQSDKLRLVITDPDRDNASIPSAIDGTNKYTVQGTITYGTEDVKYFDFKNYKEEYVTISGTKSWDDNVTDPSKRPDVVLNLKSSVDDFASVIATYTIKAPATSYTFENLPKVDKFRKLITYKVEEVPVPGYVTSVDATGLNFTNTAGKIVISKIDAKTGTAVEGAVLAILDSTGKEVERWTSTSSAHRVTADLTIGATYTLREISAPAGFVVAPDQTFTVPTDGKDIAVEMVDERVVGSVRLRKLDADTRESLEGAEFALYTESGSRVYASGSAGSYEYSETSSNGRFAVNARGELEITGLPYGSYYFVEVAAPAGYVLSSDRASFSVLSDGSVAEVTFLNTKERGSVRLRKTNADGSRSLAGAVFELYAKTPTTVSSAIAATIYSDVYYRVGTYTTDASGEIYVGDLPWDDYYFVEVEAPAGYEVNTDVNGDPIAYTFTIGSSATATVSYDLGRITNSTTPPDTPVVPSSGGEVRGERRPTDTGRRSGGVLSGVLGVRAAPKAGVLGERLGPVTGDAFNIFLWTLLLLASIGSIIAVAIANARRKKNAR